MPMHPEIEPAVNQARTRQYSRKFWLVTLGVAVVLILIAILFFLTR